MKEQKTQMQKVYSAIIGGMVRQHFNVGCDASCKNQGCPNRRREKSKYCQGCSDNHNKTKK